MKHCLTPTNSSTANRDDLTPPRAAARPPVVVTSPPPAATYSFSLLDSPPLKSRANNNRMVLQTPTSSFAARPLKRAKFGDNEINIKTMKNNDDDDDDDDDDGSPLSSFLFLSSSFSSAPPMAPTLSAFSKKPIKRKLLKKRYVVFPDQVLMPSVESLSSSGTSHHSKQLTFKPLTFKDF